jgi:recombinational DNA repair protein (RecF pathway)
MGKRLISCSKCFAPVPANKTSIKDGLRICHECKRKEAQK